MESVVSNFLLEDYQVEIHDFTLRMHTEPEALRLLLDFIESKIDQLESDSAAATFLKGEFAFYSGLYEQSLKYYLLAKTIPNFEFYCFRSSAFAAKEMNNDEKATLYVEKAKRIFDMDPTLIKLENDLAKPKEIEASKVESTNNPSSGFFATQQTVEPALTAELTKRLYPMKTETEVTFEEKKEELEPFVQPVKEKKEESFIPNPEPQDSLVERIRAHKTAHENAVMDYIELGKKRTPAQDYTLFMVGGWKSSYCTPLQAEDSEARLVTRVLQNNIRGAAAYGFYIRWKNKGYVINPGEGFLDTFHRQGFHIKDIDYVIVTRNETETYADAKQIYHLNYQVNKVSSELHVINYYLNQTCYQDLSRILKPNFKQERNAIHSLEIFIDSPEVEKTQITPEVTLHYFPIYQKGSSLDDRSSLSLQPMTAPSLGIRLDLTSDETPLVEGSGHTVKLGYLSGASWSPLLAHHLGNCDILVTGFGHTSTADYSKATYNDDNLGYYGISSLLEDLNPRVLFCTEFDGIEGDVRLDIVKKLRQEGASKLAINEHPATVLPADTGLSLSLKTMRIKCTITQEWLDPTLVQVVKTADSFGTLQYLSPDSCL